MREMGQFKMRRESRGNTPLAIQYDGTAGDGNDFVPLGVRFEHTLGDITAMEAKLH
jgi:hypothetical protein